jgi:hypothetical protein
MLLALAVAGLGWQPADAQKLAPKPLVSSSGLSEATVRAYLGRALTLQGIDELPAAERRALVAWAGATGMQFAGRVAGRWLTPRSDAEEQALFDSTRQFVRELRRWQPEVIVQGALFEIIYAHGGELTVPNSVRAEFGEDTLGPTHRTFRFADMMYPGYFTLPHSPYRWDSRPPGQAPGMPDMNQVETQMWFYYHARRQIDAGCEAIHFGQVLLMDDDDPGHQAWWSMLQRVRAYARTRNRGFVLCDAHTQGEYYDPNPKNPLPDSLRQLLFDFHSFPLRPYEADTLRHGTHAGRLGLANFNLPGEAIYRLNKGGRAPAGWYCRRLPALVEFDNGLMGVLNKPGQWPMMWGLDEISWFATQPRDYRRKWLVYAKARIQELDPSVQLQLPALRVVRVPGQPGWLYRADLDGMGELFRAIFDGTTASEGAQLLFIGPVQP